MDVTVPLVVFLTAALLFSMCVYLELAEKKPILPVLKRDLEDGQQESCKYTRNFTIEIMRDNEPIMNIDAELRHRVVWMKG
jgi:hypothetical protein